MDPEQALAKVEALVVAQTGKHLSELQRFILQQVWQEWKYLDIADIYGCTEGHAKDVGAELWKHLSQIMGEKITKKNLRRVMTNYLSRDFSQLPSLKGSAEYPYPPHFVGRSATIDQINQWVEQRVRAIALQGEGGVGKTTLAQQYLQSQGYELVLELLMAKETAHITSVERVVEEWLLRDLHEDPGLEFGISLDRLKRHLHQRRIGILIDNLEPALDHQGLLISEHRGYLELLRVLTDNRNRGLTLITSRDRICEASLKLQHYRLPGLAMAAWQQYFTYQGIAMDANSLQSMHHAYGGNAKAMELLAGAIRADFAGDLAAFWDNQRQDIWLVADLNHLITHQINRLQTLDPQAYRLFCRLGCYRYQTVANVPTEAVLALLWDVPAPEQRAKIVSLQNRSLIETHNGRYWLHPVIREAAIARLRTSPDWQLANHHAAQFWIHSVHTITSAQDALQALEAYPHYEAIADYPQAAAVLLQSRDNQWHQYLPLGSTLYRMGLHQSMLTALPKLIERLPGDRKCCELYNILGDFYWTTGNIRGAIACQEQALHLCTQAFASKEFDPLDPHTHHHLQIQELDSRLSLGLYYLDLWELATSAQFFQQVIALATDTKHHRWFPKAVICLALVTTYLGQKSQALTLLATIPGDSLVNPAREQAGQFAYFLQVLGQTYTHLGDFQQATILLDKAFSVAEASHYPQIQARTLTGQAILHRIQGDRRKALTNHQQAITLLSQINAKCDLAEAHFQLGLTYQALHHSYERDRTFQTAIQLFTEMDAPCQVQRINASVL
jgi:tetratricopeptide (TPR) repeat protein